MINERLLQFIWQFQYYNKQELQTSLGDALQIIKPGTFNTDQGPDFLHASVKINNIILAGNIELHIRSSDWNRHQHSKDSNYNNIVLHVVWENNIDIKDINGNPLPVLVLQDRIAKVLLQRYEQLMTDNETIPCKNFLPTLSEMGWLAWKERLIAERLEQKSKKIIDLHKANNGHWEEVFWQMIATNFGIKVNAVLFEEVAKSISINILAKHKNQIHQIEAMLLGQANLLTGEFSEPYPKLLQREYQFLQKKYQLKPITVQPAFLRMRPASFPTIRLAQLAMLIKQSLHLFSVIRDTSDVKNIMSLLNITANDYWHYHYMFEEETAYKPKNLGQSTIDNIIINTVVPVLFAYGSYCKDEQSKEKAIAWLAAIDKEDNSITKTWKTFGIENKSAFDSQALIQLTNHYCKPRFCLQCAVGNKLLKA